MLEYRANKTVTAAQKWMKAAGMPKHLALHNSFIIRMPLLTGVIPQILGYYLFYVIPMTRLPDRKYAITTGWGFIYLILKVLWLLTGKRLVLK